MGAGRLSHLMLAALFGTSLCACAHVPAISQTPTTESENMAMEANTAGSPQPKLDAETVTLKVLELIRASKTIADFTAERLREVTGLTINFDGPNRYGAGENLTQEWSYSLWVAKATSRGSQLMFSFDPNDPQKTPPLTDICKIDFNRFSAELTSMGFIKEDRYGLHRELASYLFVRPGLSVEVNTIGEECLRFVTIN